MNQENFNALVETIRNESMDTLLKKNSMYATEDKLHNFRVGGDIMGGTTAQACWGYLTKHLVALRDKVERNDFSDLDDLKEKCIDTINYTVFLWCIGYEEAVGKAEIHHRMTYRDMAKGLDPKRVDEKYDGGVEGCPGDLFDGAHIAGCAGALCALRHTQNNEICTDCWGRTYMGERVREGELEGRNA